MTEPTYAELIAAWKIEAEKNLNRSNDIRVGYARAVLAKWGTPPAVAGEPVAWRVHPFDYGIGSQGVYAITSLPQQRDAWLRKGWKAEPLYTTPQPTHAQAGAVPLTRERLQEISLNYSDSEDECTGFRDGWRAAEKHHGIKGGQHD